jgi:DUF1009 family protein
VKDHADPVLRDLCDDFSWVGLGKLGSAIRFFRIHGVREATMSGKIHKVVLYKRWAWLKHLPDLKALQTFYPHFVARRKDQKDDTLLSAIADAFAQDGITFAPATDYAPELLVGSGVLTARRPTRAQCKDIAFAWNVAKQMGGLDIGQCVCVKDRAVLAVEALEGTDACIFRAGTLCGAGGFTVVKVSKPQQDMRFDVPTIGLGTLETIVAAGGSVLAIEAGRTILLDQAAFIDFADRHKICAVALHYGTMEPCAEPSLQSFAPQA